MKLGRHLVATPRQGSVRVDEFRQNIKLEAHIVEVINSANDLVKRLLHQVRPHTPLNCKLTLALQQELSEHDSFPLCLGLPLHVRELIVSAESLVARGLVDQVAGHLLSLVFQHLRIFVVVLVAVVGVVQGCPLLGR